MGLRGQDLNLRPSGYENGEVVLHGFALPIITLYFIVYLIF